MKQLSFCLCVLMLALQAPVFAKPAGPAQTKGMRVVDLERLLGRSHDQKVQTGVLRMLRKEGAAFELVTNGRTNQLSKDVQEKLLELGFDQDQVDIITWIGKDRSVYLPSDPLPWAGVDEPSKSLEKQLARVTKPAADCTPGYIHSGTQRTDIEGKVKRALRKVKLDRSAFARFTMHGSKGAVQKLSALFRELDLDLAKRLTPPVGNITNAQTLHIVLANRTKDYAEICTTYARLMRMDRKYFSSKAFTGLVWFTKHLVVINVSKCDSVEEVGRLAAYGIGRSIFDQYLGYDAPYLLSIGLGHKVEAMAYGRPSVHIAGLVQFKKQLAWEETLDKVREVYEEIETPLYLLHQSGDIKPGGGVIEYAAVLSATLIKEPDKYAKALLLIRHGLLRPADAIRWAYEMDYPAINKSWAVIPDEDEEDEDDDDDDEDDEDQEDE